MKCIACLKLTLIHEHGVTISLTLNIHCVRLNTKNFFVIKRYNAADSYAMGVGMLADEIAGFGGLKQSWPRPEGTLDVKQKFELQTRMKELGYYDGEIDGNFGSGSKSAIMAIQGQLGMDADGQPSEKLLKALRK